MGAEDTKRSPLLWRAQVGETDRQRQTDGDDWSGIQTLQSIKIKSTGSETRIKSEGLH